VPYSERATRTLRDIRNLSAGRGEGFQIRFTQKHQ
jgi:hypothetical protein